MKGTRPSSLLFAVEGLEFAVALGLFAGFLNKVADGVAAEHFLGVEDLVEVAFKFFSAALDVLGTVVGDAKDLLLGEGRSAWKQMYRLRILLSSRASCTFLNSL